MPIEALIKLIFELLSNPAIETAGEAILNEIKSHDAQSVKVTQVVNNTTALLTAINSVRNGANGDAQ